MAVILMAFRSFTVLFTSGLIFEKGRAFAQCSLALP
jgi:hypothetical protein